MNATESIRVGFYKVGSTEVKSEYITDYHQILQLLDATFFDVVRREVNGIEFDIFVDDMGLILNKGISAMSLTSPDLLVGNLIFTHTDCSGDTIGISDDDLEVLENSIVLSGYFSEDVVIALD